MPAPHIPLDLLRNVIGALPRSDDENDDERHERIRGAAAAVAGLQPRDVVEAMLAGQIVVAHAAIMESCRLATTDELGEAASRRHRVTAVALMRAMRDTLGALTKRQAKPVAVLAGALTLPEANDAALERRKEPMHREKPAAAVRVPVPQFTPVVPQRIVELMTPKERRDYDGCEQPGAAAPGLVDPTACKASD
jgi:hypothetical protein